MTGTDREARDIIAASVEAEHDMDAYRQADDLIDALAAAGFEVVSSDLVSAAEGVSHWGQWGTPPPGGGDPFDRLAACLARHRGDDELNVFTEGGA